MLTTSRSYLYFMRLTPLELITVLSISQA